MNKNEFKQKLSSIKTAISVTGKRYRSIQIFGDSLEFVRENKTKSERISVTELYELFTKENPINISIAKSYISGRVQSPAVAILKELKSTGAKNISKNINPELQPIVENGKRKLPNEKVKDETRFFIGLSELLGMDYLLSKSIGKPINSSHIFLSNSFENYNFNKEVNDCYLQILTDLKSNYMFSSDSLSHHIDGVIINHPVLHSRIVEFDEEQHFTPARMDTIPHLQDILPDNYFSIFKKICNDKNYLNDYVLKKHRIKNKLDNVPKSFIEFVGWLEQSNEKSSGYICKKNGFEFFGGRIAQRAYYDCLRDTAHLSSKNSGFDIPLRFAKKKFEEIENTDFGLISMDRIKEIILEIMSNDYKMTIPIA
ncbi:hypothetical protein SAMN04488008_11452 [Maribacter orientalis]|uniref:Uncharacterized protein n=1 Tax=Maribacter orientalis TaxID=228957 RepID=A0A1H7X9M9_9FLAO|nr:hypothetical protein [Maribacter orientalis]SEM30526.1 hypothetical protein SAMN04488008_11452 [Maribacter orientalis]